MPVDASGELAGRQRSSRACIGLQKALLSRPELFVSTLTEKLLTYALGRGVESYDAPAVRKIVRDASDRITVFRRWLWESSNSTPFQMRRSHDHHEEGFAAPDVSARSWAPVWPCRCWMRWFPPMTALAATPANPVRRLGFVYIPMGATLPQWTPPATARITELSPSLQSLTPFLDQLTVISNLELKNAYSAGNHATANCRFLSAAKAKMTEGTDYHLGTTVDQIAAQQIGRETPLPSLELAMDLLTTVGQLR